MTETGHRLVNQVTAKDWTVVSLLQISHFSDSSLYISMAEVNSGLKGFLAGVTFEGPFCVCLSTAVS